MTTHEDRVRALAPLTSLLGTWRGSGWTVTPSGHVDFDQTEYVGDTAGGELLTVEGAGRRSGDPDDVRFRAFAVVGFDEETACLRWHAFHDGRTLDIALELTDGGCRWRFSPHPGVSVCFDIAVDGDTWSESGHTSTDGGMTWRQTLGMTLSWCSAGDRASAG